MRRHKPPAYRLGLAARRLLLSGGGWRSIDYRDEIIAAWRSCWWHDIREYVVLEAMVTMGSALGAAIFTGEFWGKAALGAVVGGLGAIAVLIVGQALRARFTVLRSMKHVNERATERLTALIRNGHFYLDDQRFNPNLGRSMYEQHHRHGQSFAGEVDSFLDRYYPDQIINLLREFVNLHAAPFDDLPARTAHIDRINSIIEPGLAKLEQVKRSGKRPKPTPFHIVG